MTGDDGVRLFVDGQKVLDKWIPQGRDHLHRHPPADPGHAPDRAGVLRGRRGCGREARLRADLRPASAAAAAAEPFAAEYFDNSTLSGEPVLTRTDDAIDFDWGEGGPRRRRAGGQLLGALDQADDAARGHLRVQRDG